MLLAIWVSVSMFLVPTLSGRWGHFGLDPTIGSCTILPNADGSSPKEFLFVFAFLLPAVSIGVCYARIFLIVRGAERAARQGRPAATRSPAPAAHASSGALSCAHTAASTATAAEPAHTGRRLSLEATDRCAASNGAAADAPSGSEVRITNGGAEVQLACGAAGSPDSGDRARAHSQSSQLVVSLVTAVRDRASPRRAGSMSTKDRRLLKMILVIFLFFLLCYLPITIIKVMGKESDAPLINVLGYALIYLTTCTNPIIYVVMSLEYRQAYRELLRCHFGRALPLGGNPRNGNRV